MKGLAYIAILLAATCTLLGQTGNPFDISSRLDTSSSSASAATAVASDNPFEVRDTILSSAVAISTIDTIEEPAAEVGYVPGDNPFEVDHVPIRRRYLHRVSKKDTSTQRQPTISTAKKAPQSLLFLFYLEILCLVLLALIINTQQGVLSKIYRSLTNENQLKINHRGQSGGISAVSSILYIVFFVNISAFVFLVMHHYGLLAGFRSWSAILAIVIGIYIVRHLAMWLLSTFFPFSKESALYNFTIITYNIALGIALMPSILLLALGPDYVFLPVMYLTFVLISVILLLRYLRGLTISIPYISTDPFHFLLYLCAFEIAPILLIYSRVIS